MHSGIEGISGIPHGLSMELQPLEGVPGSSSCPRPPEGDGGGTTLEHPSHLSQSFQSGKIGHVPMPPSASIPKKPNPEEFRPLEGTKPTLEQHPRNLRGFSNQENDGRDMPGRIFWEGTDFWEGIPGLGWVCVHQVSVGVEKIPPCYLWYWNFSSAIRGTDGSDWSARIEAGKKREKKENPQKPKAKMRRWRWMLSLCPGFWDWDEL